jgi:hypothetical protein
VLIRALLSETRGSGVSDGVYFGKLFGLVHGPGWARPQLQARPPPGPTSQKLRPDTAVSRLSHMLHDWSASFARVKTSRALILSF